MRTLAGSDSTVRGWDAAAVALLAFLSRLPYLNRFEQDLDGSRFVRGVMRFDLARYHPHPPGYPVYVGVATALDRALLHDPARALSVVSAAGFALLTAATCVVAATLARTRAAGFVAALAVGLGTTVTVHATRTLSDMLGAGIAWAVVACGVGCARAAASEDGRALRAALGGIAAFGLLCGTRISTVPVALPALAVCARHAWRAGARGRAALVGTAAVAAWLVPLAALTGVRELVRLTTGQAEGHFTRYGGSAVTEPDLAQRLGAFAEGMWAHVLGGAWSDRASALWISSALTVTLLGVGAGASARRWREGAWLVAASALLYAAWAFFGQNILWQPRHLLPLAPALAVVMALGAAGLAARVQNQWVRALGAVVAVVMAAPLARESHRLASLQAREHAPVARMAAYVARAVDAERSMVATEQLDGWLRHRAPSHRFRRVASAEEARALGARAGLVVYVTSEVPGVWDLVPAPEVVFRATGDRYVWTTVYDVALLRVRDAR